ncbi:MAG TPA: type VI secretion system protein TssA [Terrimicrobiaceae bacterium]
MIEIEELLNPISADSPCGEDVSYDPKFVALDTLVAGKLETQFSPAEEPDWKAVHDVCLELLNRSKNLRVAVTLCLALLKLEGASGLRAGLTLLKGLLERYWTDLYPRLDPEDNNDPLERVNILSSLSAPLSTFGDPMQFLQRLRRIPLANSPQMGRFSFADVAGDKTILPGGEEKAAAPPAQIEAAFRDTNADELSTTAQAISDSAVLARGIDSFVMDTVGAGRALDMGALVGTLVDIERCLAPYLPKPLAPTATESPVDTQGASVGEGPSEGGAIRSRQDVLRALERICQYYARTEPSSPLPLLLRRAQRLVDMNFLQIIDELTPEARTHLETIVGLKPEGDSAKD